MTKLTTYSISFRTQQDSAFEKIDAPSPEDALAEARAIAGDHDRLHELHFEPYEGPMPVEKIVVDDPGGERSPNGSAPIACCASPPKICSMLLRRP